jgi:zinc protease
MMIRSIRNLVPAALLSIVALAFFAAPAHALEIKRFKLANGAVLLVSEQHQLPMVTLSVAFDAGARRDPKGKEGLAALTAESLMQGTKQLSAAEFNQKVDFMGSSISIGANRDNAAGSFTSLRKYSDDTLHLLGQALQDPGLHDADIERKQAEQVADIKAADEEPEYVAGVAFIKQLYGEGPYGHPFSGFADSVSKLKPDDVRTFYHEHYLMGNAVIAVVGDVDADTIKGKLEREFSGLSGTVAPQPEPPTATVSPGLHPDLIDRNVAQASLILGSGGIARSNPDYYKLQVMNYILGGGGFASRLMKVVRSKAGLAYGIGSSFNAGKFPGAFQVVLQTKNHSSNDALKLILQQLRDIQTKPVSDAEMQSAKKYLIGSFPLKLDRQSEIVEFMLQTELYGLGTDYAERYPKLIGAVTKADVQQVAQQYLHPDALILVAVANLSEAKIDVAALEPKKQASSANSKGG